jgi:hypothetical protein
MWMLIPNHRRLLVHRIYSPGLAFRLDFCSRTRKFSTVANERLYAFIISGSLFCTGPVGHLSAVFVSRLSFV